VHSTILSTTSRTTLQQIFTNPSSTDAIKECTYTFPLYDGVSIVSFTCRIGKKVLTGLVKEKAKAKSIFDQAVAQGETAGLLQQAPEASDIFSTKLGNIPAGQSVVVEVTYIGELKHHEAEGIRFTIPTKIAPRYGAGPNHGFSSLGRFSAGGDSGLISIVVDVNMPEGSFIKSVQSPSHPIAVSMGTVSTSTDDEPTMSKASATLSLGSAALEKDFVLIVQSKDAGIPKAILETHPSLPNHRALMATLVPKFSLPPSRCEIVFVADRSGSMRNNMEMLVSAMKVFLKSLPQSVKFNICSFGSHHSFLWEKSQSSSRESIDEATNHLIYFSADMGGTETFGAIKSTVERRLIDIPLEIILLTDGDIHRQNDLFEYVNQQVEATKGNVRVFPLGIGNGVSHSLIEGLARAGNGFAQAVQIGERLDNAVVRMLRGALSPHITDYTLEVKYEVETSNEYELIDRVTDSMKVLLTDDTRSLKSSSSSATSPTPKPTISLFDSNMVPEKEIQNTTIVLPSISCPKLLQAPHKIPTLFAFSRTTVYLLMSPETIQRKPIAVILRGTSEHGPLALEIPVETLSSPAETIHQLGAKKAVQDLEEGRGWIYDAKDQNGVSVREKYPSCFDDMVKQEAVRLGEKFQIAGKWCSFVAVAANDNEIKEKKEKAAVAKLAQGKLNACIALAWHSRALTDKLPDESIELDTSESDHGSGSESEGSGSESFEIISSPVAQPDVSSQLPSTYASARFRKRARAPQSRGADAKTQARVGAYQDNKVQQQAQGVQITSMPNAGSHSSGTGENHALQDYQMQMMLLEQQNKKRIMMARQEQDNVSPHLSSQGGISFGTMGTGSHSALFGNTATPPPPPPYEQANGQNSIRSMFGSMGSSPSYSQMTPQQNTMTQQQCAMAQQQIQQSGMSSGVMLGSSVKGHMGSIQSSSQMTPQQNAAIQQQMQQNSMASKQSFQGRSSSTFHSHSMEQQRRQQLAQQQSQQSTPAQSVPPSLQFGRLNQTLNEEVPSRIQEGGIGLGQSQGRGVEVDHARSRAAGRMSLSASSGSPPGAFSMGSFGSARGGPSGRAGRGGMNAATATMAARRSVTRGPSMRTSESERSSSVAKSMPLFASSTANALPVDAMHASRSAPTAPRRRRGIHPSPVDREDEDDVMDLDVAPATINWSTKSTTDKVLALIDLQDFEGWWPITPSEITEISNITGVKIEEMKDEKEAKMFVTMLVIMFLERKCVDEEGTWGLVVEKGRGWLESLGRELQALEQTIGKRLA
jgi:hypothetical protein